MTCIKNTEITNGYPEINKLPKVKKVKCLYCNKFFKTESYRDQHIRDAHEKTEAGKRYPDYFVCCYCGVKLLVE